MLERNRVPSLGTWESWNESVNVQPLQSSPYRIPRKGTPRALWWLTSEAEDACGNCWEKRVLEWPSGDTGYAEAKWPQALQ